MDKKDRTNIIKAFSKWIEIREKFNYEQRFESYGFEVEALYSPLLARLLDGIEPLSEPPPRRFSYPWYDLIENGKAEPIECNLWPTMPNCLLIDQNWWNIKEKISNDEFIVTYTYEVCRERKEIKTVESTNRWLVKRTGLQTIGKMTRPTWSIEIIKDNDTKNSNQ